VTPEEEKAFFEFLASDEAGRKQGQEDNY